MNKGIKINKANGQTTIQIANWEQVIKESPVVDEVTKQRLIKRNREIEKMKQQGLSKEIEQQTLEVLKQLEGKSFVIDIEQQTVEMIEEK